jgi:hypothetical protein
MLKPFPLSARSERATRFLSAWVHSVCGLPMHDARTSAKLIVSLSITQSPIQIVWKPR